MTAVVDIPRNMSVGELVEHWMDVHMEFAGTLEVRCYFASGVTSVRYDVANGKAKGIIPEKNRWRYSGRKYSGVYDARTRSWSQSLE